MEITRIKYDMEKVIIGYENPSDAAKDVNVLQSQDQPNDEFKRSLLALSTDVLNIADLPEMYQNGLAVEEVKFTIKDNIEYVQIIAKKAIDFLSESVKLTLPPVMLHLVNGMSELEKDRRTRLIQHCNDLKDAATDYIRGRRQQESLFFNIGLTDNIQKSAKALRNTIAKNGGGEIRFGNNKVEIKEAS